MATWRKSISGSENSLCKGPGVVSVPYVGGASRRLTWWDCGGRKRRGEWWQMRSGDNRPRSLRTRTRPVPDAGKPHLEPSPHSWSSPDLPWHPPSRAQRKAQGTALQGKMFASPPPYRLLCLLVDFENKMWSQGLWKEEVYQCSGDKLLHPA